MTGRAAIQFVVSIEKYFASGKEPSNELGRELEGWSLSPILLPIAELIARAWVETWPQSIAGRNLLITCLLACDRDHEAELVEKGAAPHELMKDSPEERAHIEKLIRQAEKRLGVADT
jgi:hypothetical protein